MKLRNLTWTPTWPRWLFVFCFSLLLLNVYRKSALFVFLYKMNYWTVGKDIKLDLAACWIQLKNNMIKTYSLEGHRKFQALFCGRYTAKMLKFELSFKTQMSKKINKMKIVSKLKYIFSMVIENKFNSIHFVLFLAIVMINPWK